LASAFNGVCGFGGVLSIRRKTSSRDTWGFSMRSISETELATMIGRITIAWNDVQSEIFELFAAASGVERQKAAMIFFSLRTDASQRDITNAAIFVALPQGHVQYRLQKLLERAGKLAAERNLAIHQIWATHHPSGNMVPSPFIPRRTRLRDDFDVQFSALLDELKTFYPVLLRARIRAQRQLALLEKRQAPARRNPRPPSHREPQAKRSRRRRS
jgi:hypothetical protein